MSLVVTGSISIDSVQTPAGQVQQVLGGSAVYFAFSASLFVPVRLLGVVGDDFPEEHRATLARREIDLAGLEVRRGSKTFRWSGRYDGDMNAAETTAIELNVLAEKGPAVPQAYYDSSCIFLAATHPALQHSMVRAFPNARLVVCDTRDLWIETQKPELTRLFSAVHGVVLNDGEARDFTGEINLIKAARRIVGYGPRFVIIKKGEHGALLCHGDQVVLLPSYPTDKVRDPTGAGDSFAGGLMGYLAGVGTIDSASLKRAMAYGTVSASFTIEDFSLGGISRVTRPVLEERLARFVDMLNVNL